MNRSDGVTRRHFLQTSAVFAGTMSVVGRAKSTARAEPAGRTRANAGRIFKADKGGGIGENKAAMIERLAEYKRLGFDGIEGGSPDIQDIPALRDAIRETGLPVHGVVDGVHWEQRLSSPDPAVRERGRAALEQAVRDAHLIGGSSVLLVPGRVTGPDETHDDVWQRSIVEIRKVLPVASKLGIHILIENVGNGFCETADQFRDYVDEIDSPWVGIYFDIGNARKFGPSEEWIRTLGSHIVKVDVKDRNERGSCRLGEGDVNWPEVRRALADINFTGWATREGKDHSLADTAQLMDELLDL